MRGRRSCGGSDAETVGLIPAGAGQTRDAVGYRPGLPAHPRGCGADAVMMASMRWAMGSSPRVRGRQELRHAHGQRPGLIPAGAGQTSGCTRRATAARAHPRGVRDRPGARRDSGARAGLIPAGAGQTRTPPPTSPPTGAHPRGCGADSSALARASSASGSSPRVRGRLAVRDEPILAYRLIPAGAGQTVILSGRVRGRRAHPRGCGADYSVKVPIYLVPGSSPRVRGRLDQPVAPGPIPRLIPAGAGQTA